MKQAIKISTCLFSAAVAIMLAGCGSHDQNTPSAAGGTPPEIVQNSKNQLEGMKNHPPTTAYTPPGHTPGH